MAKGKEEYGLLQIIYVSIEALTIKQVKFCCYVMIIIILMCMIININIINKIKINNIIHIFLRLLTASSVGKRRDRPGTGPEAATQGREARQKRRKNRSFYKLYMCP